MLHVDRIDAEIALLHRPVGAELGNCVRAGIKTCAAPRAETPVDNDDPVVVSFCNGPYGTSVYTCRLRAMEAGPRHRGASDIRKAAAPDIFDPPVVDAGLDISPAFAGDLAAVALDALFFNKGETIFCGHVLSFGLHDVLTFHAFRTSTRV